MVTVSGFQKSVWEFVETSELGLRAPFSPLSPSALLSSAFLNTQTFFLFFLIVALVEHVDVFN